MRNIISESERFKGWMRLQVLNEQMEQTIAIQAGNGAPEANVTIQMGNGAPDPEPMGKLYFKRQEIYDNVLQRIMDMAPHGVSSEQQFHDIVEQAISKVHKELMKQLTPEQQSDAVLSINDIEREFRATPYISIGLHQTGMLNEDRVGMGADYAPKEELMRLFKANIIAKGSPKMPSEPYHRLLNDIKLEMIKTLDMIERTLKMIPPAVFFASEGQR